mmetsp:Transcript_17879/g.30051  ORF Transcript_17879/g.30051 Transcript_17879/m.30051 type:complete len:360 (+) Transcript_17879:88-1167(+)
MAEALGAAMQGCELEDSQMPLAVLYERGKRVHDQMESGSSTQEDIRSAATNLQNCKVAVERLALFSRNEDPDDIATGDLKFLLVPFYLGEVLLQLQAADVVTFASSSASRTVTLKGAKQEFKEFLSVCDDIDLLSALDQRAFHREEPTDANTKRNEKIAHFKRDKEIKQRLADIEAKEKGTMKDFGEGEDTGEVDYSEDDREAWLLRIEMAGSATLAHLEMIETETQILASMPPPSERSKEAPGPTPEQMLVTAALREATRSLQGGGERGERDRIRDEVFRPTHTMHTMSVEEFGEIECAEMMERSAEQTKRAAKKAAKEAERSQEDVEHMALMKARYWDDFKDDNPSGMGNSKLRPCG